MYEGCPANMQMSKTILEDGICNDSIVSSKIITYDEDKECMYLLLEEAKLTEISLDGIYQCTVLQEEPLTCSGRVTERFTDKRGNVIVFYVENGFYKNNIN